MAYTVANSLNVNDIPAFFFELAGFIASSPRLAGRTRRGLRSPVIAPAAGGHGENAPVYGRMPLRDSRVRTASCGGTYFHLQPTQQHSGFAREPGARNPRSGRRRRSDPASLRRATASQPLMLAAGRGAISRGRRVDMRQARYGNGLETRRAESRKLASYLLPTPLSKHLSRRSM